MSELRWLQQTSADVPTHDEWLCLAERRRLVQLRVPKRRSDWRLGRWTIKRAVASYFGLPQDSSCFASIAVRPAETGAPRVFIDDEASNVAVSLSHCDGVGLCALTRRPTLLGCDLEKVELRTWSFVTDYFTPSEQNIVASCNPPELRSSIITLIWSAKEAVLKALETGLRADTRSLTVNFSGGTFSQTTWQSLTVRTEQCCFTSWWRQENQFLYCFSSDPPLPPPQALETASVDASDF